MKRLFLSISIAALISLLALAGIRSAEGFTIVAIFLLSFPWGILGLFAILAGVLSNSGIYHVIGFGWLFVSLAINSNFVLALIDSKRRHSEADGTTSAKGESEAPLKNVKGPKGPDSL